LINIIVTYRTVVVKIEISDRYYTAWAGQSHRFSRIGSLELCIKLK